MFRQILSLWSKADLLQQSYETACRMLDTTKEMYIEVTECALHRQAPRFDVHKRDKQLNVMETEIRRKVLEHLSINPKQDIVASLVLVSVVGDIERIGDYSKNIEELAERYHEDASHLQQSETLEECSRRVLSFFDLVREGLEKADTEKARKVMTEHKEVRRVCDDIIERCFSDPAIAKNEALVAVLFARYLKRISAHLKNIATSVVNPFDEIGYTRPPAISEE